jgi:copper chaperone NosL
MLDRIRRFRTPLLLLSGALVAVAVRLPLWGMTLVSTQFPEGLRMVVYPDHIAGDIGELNALNHYIGMMPIRDDFFPELRILPATFLGLALLLVVAALVRRAWATALPLGLMGLLAMYGGWSMVHRLWQFGHALDPHAAIRIQPFSPPMLGFNQIAQFATYSYFTWGTFLPLVAGALAALVLAAELRGGASADHGARRARFGAAALAA